MPTQPYRLRLALAGILIAAIAAGSGAAFASDVSDDNAVAPPTGSFVPGQVLVHFSAGATAADKAALEHANDASVIGRIADLDVDVLQVPLGAEQHVITALQHSGRVGYAEVDGILHGTDVTPNDTYWSQQWGSTKINAPAAWSVTTGTAATVVAMLDTGVDATQPDLKGRLTSGYDFVNNDADPADDNGHGTETAGIVAAAGNNATGVAGLCWDCTLMPVKVLDASASGTWSELASGITWATDHGASVASMSLAGSGGSSAVQSAVTYALSHDVLLVAAAGNNANATPVYPADYSGVLSVAGTTSSDALYSWSNYGSWVDVAAPGCDYTTKISGAYGSFCGTSAAAPVVAGIAALARSAAPTATATAVVDAIDNGAVSIGSSVAYGRVDVAATLSRLSSGTTSPPPSPSPSPSPSVTPSPSTTTATYSGSLTNRVTSRTYSASTGAGTIQATLNFSKATSMTLELLDSTGQTLGETTGSGPLTLSSDVAAGTDTVVVSGPARANYSLTVASPTA